LLIPPHAFLVVEERLKEAVQAGLRLPPGGEIGKFAILTVLIAAGSQLRGDTAQLEP
jgi:hypothetical protein